MYRALAEAIRHNDPVPTKSLIDDGAAVYGAAKRIGMCLVVDAGQAGNLLIVASAEVTFCGACVDVGTSTLATSDATSAEGASFDPGRSGVALWDASSGEVARSDAARSDVESWDMAASEDVG